jgi:hypothetical protein
MCFESPMFRPKIIGQCIVEHGFGVFVFYARLGLRLSRTLWRAMILGIFGGRSCPPCGGGKGGLVGLPLG